MGVKSCFKSGCENIMCDTYVPNVGYICNDCKAAFDDYLKDKNFDPSFIPERILVKELIQFMSIEKIDGSNESTSTHDFFSKGLHFEIS